MLTRLIVTAGFMFSLSCFSVNAQTSVSGGLIGSKSGDSLRILFERIDKLFYEKPDSALFFARRSLDYSRKTKDQEAEATANLKISRVFYFKGAYNEALVYSLRALRLSREIGFEKGQGLARNNIGLVYLAQDKFEQALKEFEAALKYSLILKDKQMLPRNYFNIGLCYDEMGMWEEAIKYLTQALGVAKKYDDHGMVAMSHNRMGETYFRMGDYKRAMSFYQRVIESERGLNDWERSFAFSGLAQSHFKLGNYRSAASNARTALDLVKPLNAKWDIERSLKVLYQSHAALGDHEMAYDYLLQDKLYSDSLYDEAREKEVNALLLKQKQAEYSQLQKANQFQEDKLRASRWVIIIIAILGLFLLFSQILLYGLYRQKSRLNKELAVQAEAIAAQNSLILSQNKELEEMNYAKDQLFSVIGHDLRSPFASILQAMTMLKEGDLNVEEMKVFLDGFFERLTASAAMLDNLVLWAQSQQQGIKAIPEVFNLEALVSQLIAVSSFQVQEKNIKLSHEPHQAEVLCDRDHARIIVHNILGNAIKFTPAGGLIDVFYFSSGTRFDLHIRDTGIGIEPGKIERLFNFSGKDISTYGTNQERGIGIGLMLVKRFALENGATIQVKSEPGKGAEFIVSFPRQQIKRADNEVVISP